MKNTAANNRKNERSRKRIVIDKKFQFGLVFKVLLPLLLLVIVVFMAAYWLIGHWQESFHFTTYQQFCVGVCSLAQKYLGTHIVPAQNFWSMLLYLIVGIAAAFVVFVVLYLGIVFLYLSHRIIGPATRFEKAFSDILKGNLANRIQLREKDEFKDLANHYNNMAETLQDRIRRIHKFNQHLQNTILEMQQNPDNDKESSLEKILELSQGIEEDLNNFTLE